MLAVALLLAAPNLAASEDAKVRQARADEKSRRYEIVLVEPTGRLRANRQNFWLHGVRLPRTHVCHDSKGNRWGCGIAAFVQWSQLLGHGEVKCTEKDNARATWSCKVNGEDAAAVLLRKGWAVRDAVSDPELDAAEQLGRSRGEGIWTSAARSG